MIVYDSDGIFQSCVWRILILPGDFKFGYGSPSSTVRSFSFVLQDFLRVVIERGPITKTTLLSGGSNMDGGVPEEYF